ncbi:hypothetical protein KUCAC02_009812 [Chaenocephalus aceratus]|uniref:Uncharacterized protein n=1 Tax=Chaenocephalus aceratus TaxID=36190 RepID=A0ACB9VYT2_CHAAC|nr:hypothetical protein KUCAC02_009812 [Chaenocephalus aceratus]
MAACRGSSSKWFFTREQLENNARLNVSQLTINTAIVYMHRFYMNPLLHQIPQEYNLTNHLILGRKNTKSNAYLQQAQELVILESIVLQDPGLLTSKDLAQTSYFMATNSLHLTTFCLQYKPTVISCVCIHLACKWSNWEIPVSTDGKHWWEYVDNSVTLELLDELTHEFLQILEKTPSRLKRIRNWRATQAAKKPKGDGTSLNDNSFAGPSMLQDDASLPGGSCNPSFSKAGAAFMSGPSGDGPLSLESLAGSYNPASHSEWPLGNQSQAGYATSSIKQEPLSIPLQEPSLLLNAPVYRTDKTLDFIPVKQEQKGGQPPPPQPSPAQKLSLDRYRETSSRADCLGA